MTDFTTDERAKAQAEHHLEARPTILPESFPTLAVVQAKREHGPGEPIGRGDHRGIRAFGLAPRPFALYVAGALEETLARNDDKPDWVAQGARALWEKRAEEVGEVEEAWRYYVEDAMAPDTIEAAREALALELQDEIAVCAMLLDVLLALPATADRGREVV